MTGSDKHQPKLPDYVVIGQILRPHGVMGKLRVEPITDDPNRFYLLKRVFLSKDGLSREQAKVTDVQVGPRFVIVALDSIDSQHQAEKYRDFYIEIPRRECLPLPEGRHYIFEFIGLQVYTNSGVFVGEITDVLLLPANDVFVVTCNDREYLIPDVTEIVEEKKISSGKIIINPIEGLLS
jgi:16S rRNA processing protein RimM